MTKNKTAKKDEVVKKPNLGSAYALQIRLDDETAETLYFGNKEAAEQELMDLELVDGGFRIVGPERLPLIWWSVRLLLLSRTSDGGQLLEECIADKEIGIQLNLGRGMEMVGSPASIRFRHDTTSLKLMCVMCWMSGGIKHGASEENREGHDSHGSDV
jgi:hypothetical protein